MNRFISNYTPSDITEEFLRSLDWDVIELQFSIDTKALQEWFEYVSRTYPHLEFSFFDNPYIKPEYVPKDKDSGYGYSNGIYGSVTSWGIDWPADTDLPIPPPFAANPKFYPELGNEPYRIQQKYKVGYFKELCKKLGEDAFRYSRITKHTAGSKILGHVDGTNAALRLHIPIITDTDSKFLFGENLDRSYSFELGKAYIINASVWHSTINTSNTRAHIIADPKINAIINLARM